MILTGTAVPWRIEQHDTLASTSDLCATRAAEGDPGRLFVLAHRQSAGRGRAGREWVSPAGNFYGSLLLRPQTPAGQGGWYALLAGLSLIEALDIFLPPPSPLLLKWPNDVMAGPAKLAGILLDASIAEGRVATLVIGIGVNLAAAPAVPGRATVSLAELGARIDPAHLIEPLCARLDHWLDRLADAPDSLRTAWMRRAHKPGTPLAVDAGRISGTYEGLDAEGGLLLRVEDGLRVLRGGEVALI